MKSICVFCEGKTEKNYLQSLNRFLERNDIYELRFTGKDLEGVNVKEGLQNGSKFEIKEVNA